MKNPLFYEHLINADGGAPIWSSRDNCGVQRLERLFHGFSFSDGEPRNKAERSREDYGRGPIVI